MVVIKNFQISSEADLINVELEANENETVTKVLLWDNRTFQDYNKAIDLTSKLSQTSNLEEFTIETKDIGQSSFTGIYFMEVTTSDQECDNCGLIGIAANLIKYNECLLDKVLKYSVCVTGGCNDKLENSIISIDTLLETVTVCISSGYYSEAIDLLEVLDKLCGICDSCKTLTTYCGKSGLNFSTLDNNLILA